MSKRGITIDRDDFVWEADSRGDDDLDLENYFRQIGLRSKDVHTALCVCEERFILTVADLRQVYCRGQLKEVFPHPLLFSRIEAQFVCTSLVDEKAASMCAVEMAKPIHIKHDGVTISCDVTQDTTVRQIKEYICANTCFGLELERQQLVFCGRQLPDDKTVQACGIEPYSCLYLIATKTSSW
uniref:Ubiquitin-like domain-containing protein n=1 Tax=Minutocellus polymorphus TaxID=265543 RepID=A0A7S0ANP7_9STRA|mmetsp:Transcript_18017/g.29917  ORF Transcript_18017/g.29917 Transcript_18017/m.29917 type:complete len:183 (+) Transcript_18017:111-659(+)|eukprot:CAMPEP_0181043380 /NCGR_PEP_ID=MMETSP1070-20121207/12677_1 /TAXON_ID=265543 /ORGANISM="Minutocellus polymorphus, Strain NH13" /LENGTH=182 /DNA_ID=CAMNT_0023121705 /DNA_START=77 /DNA_END=625 /DNA_ORIENTATION=-